LYGVNAIPEQIGSLVNLEKLVIRGCDAKSIPASIGNCVKLGKFEFQGGSLGDIPETIGNLGALKKLRISIYPEDSEENKDTGYAVPRTVTIPESIGNLRSLETLELRSALFNKLPESIGNLEKLEILNVTGNFNSLPENMGNCVSLKKLNICGSERKRTDEFTLSASMNNLTDLRSFTIVDCPVKNVPDLSNWKRLRVLELIRTNINVLPESTGSLSSLQYLNLDGSPVEALPESIGALTNFECLDICDTRIHKFPRNMSNLSKWSQLMINEVNMTALLESVSALRHLPYIDVINPKIREIPQTLKNRDDFYYNGDREHPRIGVELRRRNGVTHGVKFLFDPLSVRVRDSLIEFFTYLPWRVRSVADRLVYAIKARLEKGNDV
jgi:Leucine-rich repeat (LRR) protein